jgi:hypothetical protein
LTVLTEQDALARKAISAGEARVQTLFLFAIKLFDSTPKADAMIRRPGRMLTRKICPRLLIII